jgi:CBS domain-containing protein
MIPLETKKHYRERLTHVLGTTAREIMSAPAFTISPDASIEDLAELMVERRINPIPVVKDDRLVGIISRSDIVRMMAEEFGSGETA